VYLPFCYLRITRLKFCLQFIWVWNLLPHIKGRMYTEGVKIGHSRRYLGLTGMQYNWRKLHEDITWATNLRRFRWVGAHATCGEEKRVQGFSGKRGGNRPL